jgi:cell wall assembly regulator SMI1
MLTRQALVEIEERWRLVGAPITGSLRSPVGQEELSLAQETFPLPFHEDVLTLWNWHNGVAIDFTNYQDVSVGCCAFNLIGAAEAADYYRRWRAMAIDLAAQNAQQQDYYWQPHWLPVAVFNSGESQITIDCATGAVRVICWEDEGFHNVIAPSIETVIRFWSDLISQGLWVWEDSGWTRHGRPEEALAVQFGAVR